MKKSKFLLLGSVASLASIPFVAAKCGETKEEKKPEAAYKIQIKDTKKHQGQGNTNNTQIKVNQITQIKDTERTQIKVHQRKPDQGHQLK
nr:variable surface lipoprotein [Mycoplasmopsis bovis]